MKHVATLCFALVCLTAALGACSDGKTGTGASTAGAPGGRGQTLRFPVETQPVEMRRVEYQVTAVGSVEAYERVQVTARVQGAVELVKFKEGDEVKQQQVLAEIEPKRYQAACAAARAALERANAVKAEAEAALARRESAEARNPGLIQAEEIDTMRARVRITVAEALQAQTGLDEATLNLDDAYVRAPMDGVIDSRNISTGQYVQPGTLLATFVRRDPLLLRFQIPETDAARVTKNMAAKFRVLEAGIECSATIIHVGRSAIASSRMVAVTAEVDPVGGKNLQPGAFAQVTVAVGAQADVPVIPQIAIRPSEKGFLAFVIDGDKAHERVLTLGMRTADGKVEVRAGLAPGEQLVIRGAEALHTGATVTVQKPDGGAKGAAAP